MGLITIGIKIPKQNHFNPVKVITLPNTIMTLYSPPFWLKAIYPRELTWNVRTSQREVFLTFDDGPIPEVTPLVLSILKKYNVKATFFCVGENVKKYPEIFEKVLNDGHAVGNHTFHHTKAWKTEYNTYLSEVEQCHQLVKSRLFRPPHGQINRKIARKIGKDYQIIMWSVLTVDYDKNLSGEQCLNIAIKHTKPGAIVVFHDSLKAKERMEYALPLYIEYCLKEGYSFKVLGM
jgi:peptidoglycan/xylan/chitin deacetylase (PgdA/CDA1 family)